MDVDAFHVYGEDLQLDSNGDVLLVDGDDYISQRIIRRLFTTAQDYFQHPEFGAGIGGFIGLVNNKALQDKFKSTLIENLYYDEAVSKDNPPSIMFDFSINNILQCFITYYNLVTNESVELNFTLQQ